MTDVCERCGEESDQLDDNLICFDCYMTMADMLYDRIKEEGE